MWGEEPPRQRQRRDLCARADQSAPHAQELMSGWLFSSYPGLTRALLGGLEVGQTEQLTAIAAWARGEGAARPEGEVELVGDLRQLAAARGGALEPGDVRAGGLYLLARLGEELHERERLAWSRAPWVPSPRDERARALWRALLLTGEGFTAGREVQQLYGEVVGAAFRGVAAVLRLPPERGVELGREAVGCLDLLALGGHREVAAMAVETLGDPIRSLSGALGPDGWRQVLGCMEGRALWGRARALVEREGLTPATPDWLTLGVEVVVFLRLREKLREGELPMGEVGLPGWSVITANRGRIRGRLRATLGHDPEGMGQRLVGLPCLYARSRQAMARWAWAWAWREARTGFGFGEATRASPLCQVEGGGLPLPSVWRPDERVIRSFLLLVIGRGCWPDLTAWLQGAATSSLSKTFYRCLALLPDELADPMAPERRVRRYSRLQEHLSDGGLIRLGADLIAACAQVGSLKEDRRLRENIHQVLRPWWAEEALPLPAHHLPGLRQAMAVFARAGQIATDGA